MMQILSLIVMIAFLGLLAARADSADNNRVQALNILNMSQNISNIVHEENASMDLLRNATLNFSLYCVDRSLELDKDLHEAYMHKCDLLIESGRDEEAISCCDKLLNEDPLQQDIWFKKGQALDRLKQWSESIECYDRAICCYYLLKGASCYDKMHEGDAWYYKAQDHKRMKDYSKALSCYNKSIEIYSNISCVDNNRPTVAWQEKGYALLEMNGYNESIACFRKVLLRRDKFSHSSANAYRGMGLAQLLLAKNLSSKGSGQSAYFYEQSNISYGNSIRAFEWQKDNRSAWSAYFGKGVALSFLPGRSDDSRVAFSKAAELARGKDIPYLKWIGNSMRWIFEKAKEAFDYANYRTA